MFDRNMFDAVVLAEAKQRYHLTEVQRQRLERIAGPLSKSDTAYFDEMQAHFAMLEERITELVMEVGDWSRDDFNPDKLSEAARAFYEVFGDGGDDAKAFELASYLSELDADAIIYAVAFDEALMRDWRDALEFALDFAEEKSSLEMRHELVRHALTSGFGDDAEGRVFDKIETVVGGPLLDDYLDRHFFQGIGCLFHDSGIEMSDAVKWLFRRGGSDTAMQLTAAALLDWNDEEDGGSFADLMQSLPDAHHT